MPVSVDLRVSRIHRHLLASPSFGGQVAGASATSSFLTNRKKKNENENWTSALLKAKLYTPSALNMNLIQWHTHLIVCAVK